MTTATVTSTIRPPKNRAITRKKREVPMQKKHRQTKHRHRTRSTPAPRDDSTDDRDDDIPWTTTTTCAAHISNINSASGDSRDCSSKDSKVTNDSDCSSSNVNNINGDSANNNHVRDDIDIISIGSDSDCNGDITLNNNQAALTNHTQATTAWTRQGATTSSTSMPASPSSPASRWHNPDHGV
jgi:hypothetical protein